MKGEFKVLMLHPSYTTTNVYITYFSYGSNNYVYTYETFLAAYRDLRSDFNYKNYYFHLKPVEESEESSKYLKAADLSELSKADLFELYLKYTDKFDEWINYE